MHGVEKESKQMGCCRRLATKAHLIDALDPVSVQGLVCDEAVPQLRPREIGDLFICGRVLIWQRLAQQLSEGLPPLIFGIRLSHPWRLLTLQGMKQASQSTLSVLLAVCSMSTVVTPARLRSSALRC